MAPIAANPAAMLAPMTAAERDAAAAAAERPSAGASHRDELIHDALQGADVAPATPTRDVGPAEALAGGSSLTRLLGSAVAEPAEEHLA